MPESRSSAFLRLVRREQPETETEADAEAPRHGVTVSDDDFEGGFHRGIRTYASGSAPKGRRITPPGDDEVEDDGPSVRVRPDAETILPVHRVQQVLEIYTRFMGPASKRVLDAELTRIGVTPRTLPRERLPHLVRRLAELIDTSEKRRRFLKAMTTVPGAIG